MERAEGGGEKKFHLEHRIEFYAALQFYTLKYSILLVHMWLAPSQWESPFVAPKLPRKFSLHCKIRFSFSITKAVKNKWARFGRKNSNEIWQIKFVFYVKIDNARYARMTLFWGIWNHRTRNFYSDINRHSSSIPHHGNFEFSYWLSWVERRVTRWHASLLAWWKAK